MFFTKQNITLLQLKQAPLPFNSFNYSVKPRTNKNWTYISRCPCILEQALADWTYNTKLLMTSRLIM